MAGDIRPEGTDTIIDDGTTASTEHEGSIGGGGQDTRGEAKGASGGGTTGGTQDNGGGSGAGGSSPGATFDQIRQAAFGQTGELGQQIADRARDYAGQGKDRATDALESLARMVSDAAQQVEDKVGPDYAVYARRAAETVSGMADGLKSKDIDALLEDAKGYVRNSPAIAIGAAAALGFVVARLAKSGFPTGETDASGGAHSGGTTDNGGTGGAA